jgi:hypothetical protein
MELETHYLFIVWHSFSSILILLAVLGFDLRNFVLWAGTLPLEPLLWSFWLWLFWRRGLAFCLVWHALWSCYFTLPAVARLTDMHQLDKLFFFGDEVSWTCCPGWPQTSVLPISASYVTRITVPLVPGFKNFY